MAQTLPTENHGPTSSSAPDSNADTTSSNPEPDRGSVSTSSQYPPPPVFYKSYSPSGDVPVHEAAISRDPPRIPSESFQCFGDEWKVVEPIRSLKEEGRAELFTPSKDLDLRATIRSLLRKTVRIYAELLKVVADPERAKEVERLGKDLEDHYVNILFLINQFRPHQAREILLHQLEEQVKKQKESAKRLNELVKAGRERIGAVVRKVADGTEDGEAMEVDEGDKARTDVGGKEEIAGVHVEERKEGGKVAAGADCGQDIDSFFKGIEGMQ